MQAPPLLTQTHIKSLAKESAQTQMANFKSYLDIMGDSVISS